MTSRRIRYLAGVALALAPAVAAAAEPFSFGSPAAVTRAGELTGRIVETRDGEELGRVHDFAVDLDSGRVGYVVVSVGSFLIEDSLIAVAPGALRESADADGRLVLETSAASLRNAQRFSQSGRWPVQADVLAEAGGRGATGTPPPSGEPEAEASGETPAAAAGGSPARRGTATISDGERTATLSAGERSMRVEERGRTSPTSSRAADAPAADRPAPATRFERLDSDGDGVLNRAEIAHELSRSDSYGDIDRDGSGAVDADEFQALMESRNDTTDGTTTR